LTSIEVIQEICKCTQRIYIGKTPPHKIGM